MTLRINRETSEIQFTDDELRTLKFAVEMHQDFHESEVTCSRSILEKINKTIDKEDE